MDNKAERNMIIGIAKVLRKFCIEHSRCNGCPFNISDELREELHVIDKCAVNLPCDFNLYPIDKRLG